MNCLPRTEATIIATADAVVWVTARQQFKELLMKVPWDAFFLEKKEVFGKDSVVFQDRPRPMSERHKKTSSTQSAQSKKNVLK